MQGIESVMDKIFTDGVGVGGGAGEEFGEIGDAIFKIFVFVLRIANELSKGVEFLLFCEGILLNNVSVILFFFLICLGEFIDSCLELLYCLGVL